MLLLFRYFLIAYSAVIVLAYLVLGISVNLAPLSYVFVLLANIYMVVCTRRNFMLFIVTFILFFSNYSIIINFILLHALIINSKQSLNPRHSILIRNTAW